MGGLIVNPLPDSVDAITRAEVRLDALFEFLMGATEYFPEYTIAELWDASRAVRVYNGQKVYGAAIRLWPTLECIERAHFHFLAGDIGKAFPPVRIRRNAAGELYLDL